LAFRAARPMIWRRLVFDLRNPTFSASSIPMNDVSGRSRPSLRRFTHTITSIVPRRNSLRISSRSRVSISLWRYLTLSPFSAKYVARSSDDFLVIVVISALSHLPIADLIFFMRLSTIYSISSIVITGSRSPVGRITCCATTFWCSASYLDGVADTNTVCPIFCSNS
jgi:hypothetical protein